MSMTETVWNSMRGYASSGKKQKKSELFLAASVEAQDAESAVDRRNIKE